MKLMDYEETTEWCDLAIKEIRTGRDYAEPAWRANTLWDGDLILTMLLREAAL